MHNEDEHFIKWFDGSKVVDQEGRPLQVYHGTVKSFNTFKIGKSGAFFSSTAKGAEAYTWGEEGGNLLPVYLRIENPFVGHVGRKGPEVTDLIRRAKRAGHDGAQLTYDDFPNETAFVVFRPEQIKSAIGNSGLFDRQSADITDRLGAAERALEFMKKVGPKKAVLRA